MNSHGTTREVGTAQLLSEEVERALSVTGCPALRSVDVAINHGVVGLRGRMPSYYMKQLAQSVTQFLPGVPEVRNELHVSGSQ